MHNQDIQSVATYPMKSLDKAATQTNLKPAALPQSLMNECVTHGIGFKMVDLRDQQTAL